MSCNNIGRLFCWCNVFVNWCAVNVFGFFFLFKWIGNLIIKYFIWCWVFNWRICRMWLFCLCSLVNVVRGSVIWLLLLVIVSFICWEFKLIVIVLGISLHIFVIWFFIEEMMFVGWCYCPNKVFCDDLVLKCGIWEDILMKIGS